MAKRTVALALVAVVALAACGTSDDGGEPAGNGGTQGSPQGAACPVAPTPLVAQPTLPENFPIPDELTLTEEKEAGPSTILEGFWESDLDDVYQEYQDAFDSAGYDVTFNEIEEADAEVNFAGGETTGQVKLEVECEGRTHVRITIRPA
jgi:hypothetical protein